MARKIRTGMFETNSSSVHCICISNNKPADDNIPSVLRCTTGEYGWDYRVYDSKYDKAGYLLTMIYSSENRDVYIDQLRRVLEKNGVKLDEGSREYYYIDHVDEWDSTLEKILYDEDRLMRFLFSVGSFVETANDNDSSVGLIEDDISRYRKYGYEVFVK